jgi:hypothetical protein
MATGDDKRQRTKATPRRRRARPREAADTAPRPTAESGIVPGPDAIEASAHYQREKARRAQQLRPPDHPLEQARRAYEQLRAADAARAKGGRPKKDAGPR